MDEPIDIDTVLKPSQDEALRMPDDVGCTIPSPLITIHALLLAEGLPPTSPTPTADLLPASSCITDTPVCWTIDHLLQSPIPPGEWLGDLDVLLRRRLESRAVPISIHHPSTPGLYLPLWAERFWSSMLHAVRQRAHWAKAVQWLSGKEGKGVDSRMFNELIARVPWGMKNWAIPESTSPIGVLAEMVSPMWYRERHIDTFASYLSFRARGLKEKWWIGGLALSAMVKALPAIPTNKDKGRGGLSDLRREITTGGYKRLLFPAHVDGNHWVVFYVDIEKGTLSYGDSQRHGLQSDGVRRLCRGLLKWLPWAFGGSAKFKESRKSLPIGAQEDSYSCGPCVLNAMEHAVFNVPLFKHLDRHTIRMELFVKILRHLSENAPQPVGQDTTLTTQGSLLPPLIKPTDSDSDGDPVFYSVARQMAPTLKVGQAFHSLGFDGERRVVNMHLAAKLSRQNTACERILSAHAKEIIRAEHMAGKYRDRMDKLEPPHMAPSDDEGDYSFWCSLCNDFASQLVLCAGCRVGICVKTRATLVGCLQWDASIQEENFVYYCPYCARVSKTLSPLCLVDQQGLPDKTQVLYRYDPPVLIVSLKWHEKRIGFGELLHNQLLLSYMNHAECVMFLDVPLDGSMSTAEDYELGGGKPTSGKARKMSQLIQAVIDFLVRYPTAKIIVVIDTHCLEETGFFVCEGTTPGDYVGCDLTEIISQCIPSRLRNFLSDSPNAPTHAHKSIILNLACGATIRHAESRHSLLEGHCADAVLSLANMTTVVGDVSPTLSRFCVLWATTPSDYDVLFAMAMRDDWARRHRPVLSRAPNNHVLYTGYLATEPYGQVSQCVQGCGIENRTHNVGGRNVVISCRRCDSSYTVEKVASEVTTLGIRSIVKTAYPPGPATITPVGKTSTTGKASQSVVATGPGSRRAQASTTRGLTLSKSEDRATNTTGNRPPPPTSQSTFLSPPPTIISRSTSLPTPPPQSIAALSEVVSSTDQQAASWADRVHTPDAVSPPVVQPVDLPTPTRRPLTLIIPPLSAIVRSRSLPQMDERQESLKRTRYAPYEASTSRSNRRKRR